MTIRRSGMAHFHFLWRYPVHPVRDFAITQQSQSSLEGDLLAVRDPQEQPFEQSGQMEVLPFRNPTFALQSLSSLKDDPIAMQALRVLLAESPRRIDGSRLTDDETLAEIVHFIRSGELLAGIEKHWLSHGCSGPEEPSPAPAAVSAPQRMATRDEPDPATFPTNFDGVAQAAVLVSAASSGVPFCAT